MNRTILSVVSLVITAASLHAQTAQTIAGTWQGTLTVGANTNRVAITIKKNSDASLHGALTLGDREGGMVLTAATFSGPDVTFAVDYIILTFHGKLSADGKSIDGTWAQGKQSIPLTLTLATPDTLWKHAASVRPAAMAANADPSFEVATIKPCEPMEHSTFFDLTGRPFQATNASARELVKMAYNVRGRQVLGGPSWFVAKQFNVTAQPDTPGVPSEDQGRLMVRKLLVERFHLVAHTEQQPFPVMALTLDPKGPALKPSDPDFNGHGMDARRIEGTDFVHQFYGVTMAQFLYRVMTYFQDRQIVDETGLTGIYDITIRFPASANTDDERGSAYISAIEHLGFKFVSKKEPIPVVIIDHIEQPTPD